MNEIAVFEDIKNLIIEVRGERVLLDNDVAKIYGVETRDINKAVKNNPDKFPQGYIIELTQEEKKEVVENFHHLSKLKFSPHTPKAFNEKGLYMLATILKSKGATKATIAIIETFAKIKELSRNINEITKTTDENRQKELAQKSSEILEDIIEIEPDVIDENEEIIETTTKFEFNLGFAKISRSVKKVKK